MTTTKKIIELLVTLLPSVFILLFIIPFYRLSIPPNIENPTGITAIIVNIHSTISYFSSIVALIIFIVAVVIAIKRFISYYYWLTGQKPACPHCGSMMKVRMAKRGRYRGQQFWGCSYFILGCHGKIHIG
ncbi:MAG: hypothetical protein VSS75_026965 [Candidatus Parabeggiatoa sp.]|nr:hypothetical protein [Candidatus Parabeggiatoa sp.]